METALSWFGLVEHYGIAIALLILIVFFFGLWAVRRMTMFYLHHEEVHDRVLSHHKSNEDPESDTNRQITRHEVRSLMREVKHIVENKGCVETCPAIPAMVKRQEELNRKVQDALSEMRTTAASTEQRMEKISLRVEGFIDDWGTGLLSLLKGVYTSRQGDIDRASREEDDKAARRRSRDP